ncbi:hypothetical protein Tco_1219468 [Tanacetum coccineum]
METLLEAYTSKNFQMSTPVLLVRKESNTRPPSSEAKNGGEKTNEDTGLKSNEEPVDQAHQIFLEELEKLKRQEQEANDAAEALRNKST